MQYNGRDLPVKRYPSPDERDVIIRDTNYAAIWETRDLELIQKKFKLIRIAHNRGDLGKIKEIWDNGIQRKFDRMDAGQYVSDTPDDPKPLDAVKKNDLLTNFGMGLLCSIIIGNTAARPSHYASGNGTSIPNLANSKLDSERARIGIFTDGFATAAGTTLRYGAVFIPTFPSHIIAEAGVVNAALGGTFLNRTLYPTPRLVHTVLDDFYTLAITLSLTAV